MNLNLPRQGRLFRFPSPNGSVSRSAIRQSPVAKRGFCISGHPTAGAIRSLVRLLALAKVRGTQP